MVTTASSSNGPSPSAGQQRAARAMEAAEQAVDQVTTAWKAAIEDETRAERHSTAIDAHRQNAQSHLETARAAAEADPFDETKHPEDARKAAQRAGDERRAVEQLQTQTESQDPEKALASTREVAKGWVTGVTGLFGLFGLGSIVFANDAVSGLRGEKFWGIPAEPVFGISALIAVVAGGMGDAVQLAGCSRLAEKRLTGASPAGAAEAG